MRPYRGKRKDNGEWVQGYLFKIWEQVFILWGTTNGIPNMIEVDPDTVGQETGLTDKNANKIYGGQYVRVKIQGGYSDHYCDKDYIIKVTYNNEKACWEPFERCRMWKDESGNLSAVEIVDHPHLLEVSDK